MIPTMYGVFEVIKELIVFLFGLLFALIAYKAVQFALFPNKKTIKERGLK